MLRHGFWAALRISPAVTSPRHLLPVRRVRSTRLFRLSRRVPLEGPASSDNHLHSLRLPPRRGSAPSARRRSHKQESASPSFPAVGTHVEYPHWSRDTPRIRSRRRFDSLNRPAMACPICSCHLDNRPDRTRSSSESSFRTTRRPGNGPPTSGTGERGAAIHRLIPRSIWVDRSESDWFHVDLSTGGISTSCPATLVSNFPKTARGSLMRAS